MPAWRWRCSRRIAPMSRALQENAVPVAGQEHAAVAAWKRFCPTGRPASNLETLKPKNRKSAVYRLLGAAPDGRNVIAKRCRSTTAALEEFVYREILPALEDAQLHLHGTAPDVNTTFSWLFVEDAGDAPFQLHDAGHQVLAAQWLARLHACRIPDVARAALPARGSAFHRQILAEAHATILSGLANPAFAPDEVCVLESIARDCRRLEAREADLLRICESMPPVLVHGDLARKNVRIQPGRFVPFDWETSGIGFPAVDLAVVDIATYWSETSILRPNLPVEALQRIANLGRIFWCLAPIRGETASFAAQWVTGVMGKMRFYESQISEAMQELGWRA